MKIVYCGAHSILEHDEIAMFHHLGHEVFSIGAYIHPSKPSDVMRPPLDIPEQSDLIKAVDALGQQGHIDTLMAAKDMGLPDAVLDWADVIIYSAYEHRWLIPNWDRIKGKRVIWRTIGQSAHPNEALITPFRKDGLEIVRYSPKERNIPNFAGEDALIRFYKDPDEWTGWTGEEKVVTNVTQNLYMRSLADDGALQMIGYQWTSFTFWERATDGLLVKPAGPGSERIGGLGMITTERQKELLRKSRAYVATGTQPASYVLNFIEAMMTGIPTISLGPDWFCILPYGHDMLEMHELAPLWTNDPLEARGWLQDLLNDDAFAESISKTQRQFAIETFGKDAIAAQWAAYLDGQALAVAA